MIESVEEYESLVEHADSDVRRTAITQVANEQVWFSILETRPDLVADVALNKQLPTSVIDFLISNQCTRARSLIAMKRSLSKEQFLRLANDKDDSVRIMIANNKKTPLTILEQLTHDECDVVSHAARDQLQI